MLYTPLDMGEILELDEKLMEVFKEGLEGIIISLNRNGRLPDLLNLIGHPEFLEKSNNGYVPLADRSVLILGASKVSANDIKKTLKICGIPPDRVELHLEYELNGFDIDKLKYSIEYSLILIGPIPHSLKGKDDYSSVLNRLEKEDGFPPVIRLMAGDELKITKTSLKDAIYYATNKGFIIT